MANRIRAGPAVAEGWALWDRRRNRVTWYCYCPFCGEIHAILLGKGYGFIFGPIKAECGLGRFEIKPIEHPDYEPWAVDRPEWER